MKSIFLVLFLFLSSSLFGAIICITPNYLPDNTLLHINGYDIQTSANNDIYNQTKWSSSQSAYDAVVSQCGHSSDSFGYVSVFDTDYNKVFTHVLNYGNPVVLKPYTVNTVIAPCIAPQILDTVTNTCVAPAFPSPVVTSQETDTEGFTLYNYDNGSHQICNPSFGFCTTLDKDGLQIPNIPINGTTYQTSSDIVTNRLLNLAGTTLAVVGGTAVVVGSGGSLAPLVLSAGLHLKVGGAVYGGAIYTENVTDNGSGGASDNNPSTTQGMKISLLDYSPSVESSNISKSTDTSGNTVSTLPTAPDGSTQKVTVTPDNIVSEITASNGSLTTVTVPKTVLTAPIVSNDLSSVNNEPPISYTIKTTPAPIINTNGTVTTPASTTVTSTYTPSSGTVSGGGSVSSPSSTTANASSSPTTTSTTGTNSAGVSSTSQTDLSPITDRLNQMINQNNLQSQTSANGYASVAGKLDTIINQGTDGNSKLDAIKKSIDDKNMSVNIDLNTTNGLLDGILKKVSDTNGFLDSNSTLFNLDSAKDSFGTAVTSLDTIKGEFSNFYNNQKTNLDNLTQQVNNLKNTLNGGFTNSLPSATVTSCPYSHDINFIGQTISINIDVCEALSSLYSTLYILFYILFFGSFLQFIFGLIINTRD
ncbi:MAG: hypothetical protein WC656_11835 [Sulfurimonas sp.]|jgi:hypothetical protein